MAISSKTENLRALSCSGSVVENKKSLNETLFTGSIGRWKLLPLVAISRTSVNLWAKISSSTSLFIRSWRWIRDKKKKNITRKWWEIKGAPVRFLCYNLDGYVTIHMCGNAHKTEGYISLLWKGTRFSFAILPNGKHRETRCAMF